MVSKNKQIKISKDIKRETSVKVINSRPSEERIVFSFSFFNGNSININNFNNFYFNEYDSKKAISDFFETLKNISKYKLKELFEPSLKSQFHYNEFSDKNIINRINKVLINGYGMSKDKVKEFEDMYFEFSITNGRRVIGTRVYDDIFEILFIDNNHMICLESSRNIKIKENSEYPGVFGKIDKEEKYKEYEKSELLQMLIEDLRKGLYSTTDFIKEYDELFATIEC